MLVLGNIWVINIGNEINIEVKIIGIILVGFSFIGSLFIFFIFLFLLVFIC